MFHSTVQSRFSLAVRFVSCFLISTFLSTTILPPGYAQSIGLSLPIPGTMVSQSPAFVPVLLKGMTVHPENPLQFDFIIDSGHEKLSGDELKKESERLVKYFLASMTVPQNDLWVNLSPYEKDRIIPDELGKTELGRDLLAQDYILKQLTATMMYPEEELGKKFWDRVYKLAKDQYGITEIPTNTFNKVWILPESASVYEHENTVYITDSHLKVMLDVDYFALQNSQSPGRQDTKSPTTSGDTVTGDVVTQQIIREIILPEIEREVNTGKNFATLRQIYHSLILAKWYKQTVKNSIMSQVYIDKNKTAGIELTEAGMKEEIYGRYMQAYKKGVFNYIKEDYDELSKTVIPRQYFSGGFKDEAMVVSKTDSEQRVSGAKVGPEYRARFSMNPEGSSKPGDLAMLAKNKAHAIVQYLQAKRNSYDTSWYRWMFKGIFITPALAIILLVAAGCDSFDTIVVDSLNFVETSVTGGTLISTAEGRKIVSLLSEIENKRTTPSKAVDSLKTDGLSNEEIFKKVLYVQNVSGPDSPEFLRIPDRAPLLRELIRISPENLTTAINILGNEKTDRYTTRHYLIDTMSELGQHGIAAKSTLENILNDEDQYMRKKAALALFNMNVYSESVAKAFVESITLHEGYSYRYQYDTETRDTLKNLGKMGINAQEAVPILITALNHYVKSYDAYGSADLFEISKDIITTISQIGPSSEEDVKNLGKLFLKYSGNYTFVHSRGSLDKYFHRMFAQFGEQASPILPDLIKRMWGPNPSTGAEFAKTIWKIDPEIARAEIMSMLSKNGGDSRVAEAFTPVLQEIGETEEHGVPYLLTLAKSYNRDVKMDAVKRLKALGSKAKSAVPDLQNLLSDEDYNFRSTVKSALLAIDPSVENQREVAFLIFKTEIVSKFSSALPNIALTEKKEVPFLIALLNSSNLTVQIKAVERLQTLGDEAKSAISALRGLLLSIHSASFRDAVERAILTIDPSVENQREIAFILFNADINLENSFFFNDSIRQKTIEKLVNLKPYDERTAQFFLKYVKEKDPDGKIRNIFEQLVKGQNTSDFVNSQHATSLFKQYLDSETKALAKYQELTQGNLDWENKKRIIQEIYQMGNKSVIKMIRRNIINPMLNKQHQAEDPVQPEYDQLISLGEIVEESVLGVLSDKYPWPEGVAFHDPINPRGFSIEERNWFIDTSKWSASILGEIGTLEKALDALSSIAYRNNNRFVSTTYDIEKFARMHAENGLSVLIARQPLNKVIELRRFVNEENEVQNGVRNMAIARIGRFGATAIPYYSLILEDLKTGYEEAPRALFNISPESAIKDILAFIKEYHSQAGIYGEYHFETNIFEILEKQGPAIKEAAPLIASRYMSFNDSTYDFFGCKAAIIRCLAMIAPESPETQNVISLGLQDKDDDVKRAAERARDTIEKAKNQTQAKDPAMLTGPYTLNGARKKIDHQDWRVRLKAVQIIAKKGNKDDIFLLSGQLLRETNPNVEAAIIKALGDFKDWRSHQRLLTYLSHDNDNVRIETEHSLNKMGVDNVTISGAFFEALKSSNSGVRRNAANRLGEYGRKFAVEPLLKALSDKDEAVRLAAYGSLKRVEQVQPKLVTGAYEFFQNSSDEQIRLNAIKILNESVLKNQSKTDEAEVYDDRLDRAMLSATQEDAIAYQQETRQRFESFHQQAHEAFFNVTDPEKSAFAPGSRVLQESLFHHIPVTGHADIRQVYQQTQEILHDVLGGQAGVVDMDLNEIHVTIANDDIDAPEKFFLTLDQLFKEVSADAENVAPFSITLIGPRLMKNGVVVMEFTTNAPEFLHLRRRAEQRINERKQKNQLASTNRAFAPNIIHSTVSDLRDTRATYRQMQEIFNRLDRLHQETTPVTITVDKMVATYFRESDRRFIESREIPLGDHAMLSLEQKRPEMIKSLQNIVNYLAVQDQLPEQADLIMVLGSNDLQVPVTAARLYKEGRAKKIFVSGGAPAHLIAQTPVEEREANKFKALLIKEGVKEEDIYVEFNSFNTVQNIEFSKKIIEEQGIAHDTVILVQFPIGARMAAEVYKKQFGKNPIVHAAYIPDVSTLDDVQLLNIARGALMFLGRFDLHGPKGLGFINTVNIPDNITGAWDYARNLFLLLETRRLIENEGVSQEKEAFAKAMIEMKFAEKSQYNLNLITEEKIQSAQELIDQGFDFDIEIAGNDLALKKIDRIADAQTMRSERARIKQQLIDRAQQYIDLISQGDDVLPNVNAFLVLGNPDIMSMIHFATTWKNLHATSGKNIPIVLAGGRGRGTVPLIENTIKWYADSITEDEINYLRHPDRYESDVIRFILQKENVPLEYVQKENAPSKTTLENFINSRDAVKQAVAGISNPIIAITTWPPLLMRVKATAEKVWENEIAAFGWNVKKLQTYQLDLTSLSDTQLVQLLGYMAGYPVAYQQVYPKLSITSELKGSQRENNLNVKTVPVSDAQWQLLSDVQTLFEQFLDVSNVTYDTSTNNLSIQPANDTVVGDQAMLSSMAKVMSTGLFGAMIQSQAIAQAILGESNDGVGTWIVETLKTHPFLSGGAILVSIGIISRTIYNIDAMIHWDRKRTIIGYYDEDKEPTGHYEDPGAPLYDGQPGDVDNSYWVEDNPGHKKGDPIYDDQAMLGATQKEAPGGIDMNTIDIDRQISTEAGQETHTIQFDMKGMEELLNMDIQGFSPVIIDMIPINSVLPLLGLAPLEKGIKYGQEEAQEELQLSKSEL